MSLGAPQELVHVPDHARPAELAYAVDDLGALGAGESEIAAVDHLFDPPRAEVRYHRVERSAKIEAFARFANAIAGPEVDAAAADMGPLVRTKVVVLAWAFDSLYRGDYLERLVRKPERFGELEVTA